METRSPHGASEHVWDGSQRTSLQRGWGGGWRKFVGPGPLVCGVLLIATGCANNYISEWLLTQFEKQYNTEPVGLREDLKGLCNSSRALISALSCFWKWEMGTLENFTLDLIIHAGEVQTQMANLEIAAFQITGKAATFSLYNKENNSNKPRVASNYSKQDNWRLEHSVFLAISAIK